MNERRFQFRTSNHATALRRRGYALLLSLILLMLAALATIAISRSALARALSADEKQNDLQRHWGNLSCRMTLLPQAEKILTSTAKQRGEPQAIWRSSVVLGNQNFDFIVGDESAKLNADALLGRKGLASAEMTIRRLCLASALASQVQLRGGPSEPTGQPMITTFSSIFDQPTAEQLNDWGGNALEAPATLLTCWGDGHVNICRADEAVLREACDGILDASQVQQIIELRRGNKPLGLNTVLSSMQLSPPSQAAAEQILTDHSSAHSLWIRCSTTRRSWWTLSVDDQTLPPQSQLRYFQW